MGRLLTELLGLVQEGFLGTPHPSLDDPNTKTLKPKVRTQNIQPR